MVGVRILSSIAGEATFPERSLLLKLFVLLAAVAFFAWEFRSWYRLRKIPGPFLASISVLWQLKKAVGGTYHEHLNDVARKYGTVAFLSFSNALSLLSRFIMRLVHKYGCTASETDQTAPMTRNTRSSTHSSTHSLTYSLSTHSFTKLTHPDIH